MAEVHCKRAIAQCKYYMCQPYYAHLRAHTVPFVNKCTRTARDRNKGDTHDTRSLNFKMSRLRLKDRTNMLIDIGHAMWPHNVFFVCGGSLVLKHNHYQFCCFPQKYMNTFSKCNFEPKMPRNELYIQHAAAEAAAAANRIFV